MYARLPEGELMMPYRRWRRLREEHRDCCRECPVRKRLEGTPTNVPTETPQEERRV